MPNACDILSIINNHNNNNILLTGSRTQVGNHIMLLNTQHSSDAIHFDHATPFCITLPHVFGICCILVMLRAKKLEVRDCVPLRHITNEPPPPARYCTMVCSTVHANKTTHYVISNSRCLNFMELGIIANASLAYRVHYVTLLDLGAEEKSAQEPQVAHVVV